MVSPLSFIPGFDSITPTCFRTFFVGFRSPIQEIFVVSLLILPLLSLNFSRHNLQLRDSVRYYGHCRRRAEGPGGLRFRRGMLWMID